MAVVIPAVTIWYSNNVVSVVHHFVNEGVKYPRRAALNAPERQGNMTIAIQRREETANSARPLHLLNRNNHLRGQQILKKLPVEESVRTVKLSDRRKYRGFNCKKPPRTEAEPLKSIPKSVPRARVCPFSETAIGRGW